MSTLLLTRFAPEAAAPAVSQTTESFGIGGSRGVLLVVLAIAAFAGFTMAARAVAPLVEVIKSVVAAGLSALLMTAVVALALILAVTSV